MKRIYFILLLFFVCANKEIPKQLFLFAACSRGDINTVKIFVEKDGIDINLNDKSGRTAIFYAVSAGSLKVAEYLLQQGAIINILDNKKISPLSLAIVQNNYEIAKLLLDNGADPNMQIGEKDSPLTYAIKQGHNNKIISLLTNYGAKKESKNKTSRLHKDHDFKTVNELLERKTAQNKKEKFIKKNALKILDINLYNNGTLKINLETIKLSLFSNFIKNKIILDSETIVNINAEQKVKADVFRTILRTLWKEGILKIKLIQINKKK